MSGYAKRILALMVSALASAFIGLGWGVVLRLLGESVLNCVKDGAAAGAGTFGACFAVVMVFHFKADAGTSQPASPRTPTA
ncbi:hypothetical protein [Streptomyces sp. NPDC060187]|uniref:hypothetical protein n=1 Tax=Streptomyces sp. NPDC060187 TaxID=3347067 RepID=UPI003664A1D4